MIRWATIFLQGVTDRFPGLNLGKPDDSTGIGVFDGFPFNEAWLKNVEGALQAIRAAGTLSPIDPDADIPVSGVYDQVGASDIVDALDKRYGAPGVIEWWGGKEEPSTLGLRLLPLRGGSVLRADYPDLDEAVYVGDADNGTAPAFYRSDNAGGGSRSTTGIYLQLPDARGRFLRARDEGAGVDVSGDLPIGTELADSVPNLIGSITARNSATNVFRIFSDASDVFSLGVGSSGNQALSEVGSANYAHTVSFDASGYDSRYGEKDEVAPQLMVAGILCVRY